VICIPDVTAVETKFSVDHRWIRTAEVLGYSEAECVVFEDSAVGVESAKAAGMFVIACLTTHPQEKLQAAGADIIVKDLTKVKANLTADGRIEITILNSM
jgi:beta-phosphoglucomutase-like phosphatase (HAD superfamily)